MDINTLISFSPIEKEPGTAHIHAQVGGANSKSEAVFDVLRSQILCHGQNRVGRTMTVIFSYLGKHCTLNYEGITCCNCGCIVLLLVSG